MVCSKCGKENPLAKKCCRYCGAILEGYAVNNVTGVRGYRGADGLFYKSKEDYNKLLENKSTNILNNLPEKSILLFQKNGDGTFSPISIKSSQAELLKRFLAEFSSDDPLQKLADIKLKQV